jgi:hypothetical protein
MQKNITLAIFGMKFVTPTTTNPELSFFAALAALFSEITKEEDNAEESQYPYAREDEIKGRFCFGQV